MLAGLPLAVALEASQVMISSRTPGLEDATIAVSGVVLGALLWRVGQRVRAPWGWLALLVAATAVAAAMEMLSPFEIAHDRRLFNWLPFMGYYAFTTFQTLSHVLEIWLLYFPLGFGCGLVVKKPVPAMVTAGIVTFVIAAPVEYGQGWIVGRYPDVTDIAMSVVGGWLGAWAATAGAAMFDEVVASLRGS
jgi:glycopeptide antibiotics resistance protein